MALIRKIHKKQSMAPKRAKGFFFIKFRKQTAEDNTTHTCDIIIWRLSCTWAHLSHRIQQHIHTLHYCLILPMHMGPPYTKNATSYTQVTLFDVSHALWPISHTEYNITHTCDIVAWRLSCTRAHLTHKIQHHTHVTLLDVSHAPGPISHTKYNITHMWHCLMLLMHPGPSHTKYTWHCCFTFLMHLGPSMQSSICCLQLYTFMHRVAAFSMPTVCAGMYASLMIFKIRPIQQCGTFPVVMYQGKFPTFPVVMYHRKWPTLHTLKRETSSTAQQIIQQV